jgi:hypothetical protein
MTALSLPLTVSADQADKETDSFLDMSLEEKMYSNIPLVLSMAMLIHGYRVVSVVLLVLGHTLVF